MNTQLLLREQLTRSARLDRYVLRNVRLNSATTPTSAMNATGFFLADLTVDHGRILATTYAGSNNDELNSIDAAGRVALPLFVDCHTHLDKGHILPRTLSADGTFDGALAATRLDRTANWTAADVARRMDFSLRSALHYGTAAIRTHLDSQPPQDDISWPVFTELKQLWRGRIELQASSLFPVDMARDDLFLDGIAKRVAAAGGTLGAVAYPAPDLGHLLNRMFQAAEKYGLDLDFHADETADPAACALRQIAQTKLQRSFSGKVLVGHCCSLAMQEEAIADATLDMVAASGIAIVTLPACNLYLQDRRNGRTPRWRGVTLLHEMKKRGVPVAIASDNTRDPFHSLGDLDMLDTFRLATRVLHLDHPDGDWIRAATATPSAVMGLSSLGSIANGQPADFVLYEGRNWSELLSRAESNRIVVRNGAPISTSLPAYAELDGVAGLAPL